MSLSQQFAEILEDQRRVLTLRLELVKVRRKQYELWVTKARRQDAHDLAELIEKGVVAYFANEETAIDFLLTCISDLQNEGADKIAQWELERRKNG